ncbi:unnamed protein product, partial [Polarella glacialis]
MLTDMRRDGIAPNLLSASSVLSAGETAGEALCVASALHESRRSLWAQYASSAPKPAPQQQKGPSQPVDRLEEPLVCAVSALLEHGAASRSEERLLRAAVHRPLELRLKSLAEANARGVSVGDILLRTAL